VSKRFMGVTVSRTRRLLDPAPLRVGLRQSGTNFLFESRRLTWPYLLRNTIDLSNIVIPRAVSEHKHSSLCEQVRGTLCLL
jgi:hypothetical protein